MKKNILTCLAICAAAFTWANDLTSEENVVSLDAEKLIAAMQAPKEYDPAQVSESFGHLIGKNLETLGMEFDIDQVIKGIKDAANGMDAPLSESECIQAITQIQEKAFQTQADNNLAQAEEFLAKNSLRDDVIEIESGKLQYKLEKEGSGAMVEEHFSPRINYTGTFLDGNVFGSSEQPEVISLDETIPGFTKSIVGMKEGEKRVVYIHPDLGYGTTGYLSPNSLLTFEIEIVEANVQEQIEETMSTNFEEEISEQIASVEDLNS